MSRERRRHEPEPQAPRWQHRPELPRATALLSSAAFHAIQLQLISLYLASLSTSGAQAAPWRLRDVSLLLGHASRAPGPHFAATLTSHARPRQPSAAQRRPHNPHPSPPRFLPFAHARSPQRCTDALSPCTRTRLAAAPYHPLASVQTRRLRPAFVHLPTPPVPTSRSFAPGGFEIASLAAGGAIVALEAVLAGQVDNAYCLVRPPGVTPVRCIV